MDEGWMRWMEGRLLNSFPAFLLIKAICPMVITTVFDRHHRLIFGHKLNVAVAVQLLGKEEVSTRKLSLSADSNPTGWMT